MILTASMGAVSTERNNSEPSNGRREKETIRFDWFLVRFALAFVETILRLFYCFGLFARYITRTIQHAQLPSADCECRRRSNTLLTLMLFLLVPHRSLICAMRSLAATCMGDSRFSRQTRTHTHRHISHSTLSRLTHSTRIFHIPCKVRMQVSFALFRPISVGRVTRCHNHFSIFVFGENERNTHTHTPIACSSRHSRQRATVKERAKERKPMFVFTQFYTGPQWMDMASLDRPTNWMEIKCNEWYKRDETIGCRCRCCCAIVVSRLKCFSTENKRRSRSERISLMVWTVEI